MARFPAAAGTGGPAGQHDGQPDLPVLHGGQCAGALFDARIFGSRSVSDQLLPDEPVRRRPAVRILTDESRSNYQSLQIQFRQRYRGGLSSTANYTYSTANTDRYADSATSVVDYFTLRDKNLNYGPDVRRSQCVRRTTRPTSCRSGASAAS